MSDLMVLAFANEADAVKLRDTLFALKQEELIQPADAVFVVRRPDGRMKVSQEARLASSGADQGVLLDFVFWLSWQKLVPGAGRNAPSGQQGYIGVDDKFVEEINRTVEPCPAALFLLVAAPPEDKVMRQLQDFRGTILKTSLSKEDEATLKEVFGR